MIALNTSGLKPNEKKPKHFPSILIQGILYYYTKGRDKNDYVFPIIKRNESPVIIREDIKNRLRRYNKNLERIALQCGISEKLTSYVSRHSWATIAKKSGIDLGIISDALGHQDMQVTRTYLDSFGSDDIDRANECVLK